MKKVTLTARQFDHFVFPPIAKSNAKTANEFEVLVRLMGCLKDPALTREITPTKEDDKRAEEIGLVTFSLRRLLEEQAAFMLMEDEWKLLVRLLDAHKPQISAIAAEEYDGAVKAIESAPEVEVQEKTPK